MEENTRTIWEFDDGFFCIEDGSKATEEEIAAFRKKHEQAEEEMEKEIEADKKESDEWISANKDKIITFFEIENEDIDCYNHPEKLSYQLATWIFDNIPSEYYSTSMHLNNAFYNDDLLGDYPISSVEDFVNYAKRHPEFYTSLEKIKKLFPSVFADTVVNFLMGNHDT